MWMKNNHYPTTYTSNITISSHWLIRMHVFLSSQKNTTYILVGTGSEDILKKVNWLFQVWWWSKRKKLLNLKIQIFFLKPNQIATPRVLCIQPRIFSAVFLGMRGVSTAKGLCPRMAAACPAWLFNTLASSPNFARTASRTSWVNANCSLASAAVGRLSWN